MSILIKGIEMPKNCDGCKLCNGVGKECGKAIFYCAPIEKWVAPNPLERADDCPIIKDSFVVSREEYEGLELVCKNYEEALKDAVDELEKSDRKRGKIITNEFGNESCSVCHYGLVLFITDENGTLKKPNYCPNCGADMRGENNV